MKNILKSHAMIDVKQNKMIKTIRIWCYVYGVTIKCKMIDYITIAHYNVKWNKIKSSIRISL